MTNEIKENIRKAYNDIADKYLEWTEPTHKTRLKYLDLLLDSLNTTTTTTSSITSNDSDDKTKEKAKGKGKVLELGCGAGIPCTQILAKRFNVTANDISDSQIALARKLLPESEYSVKFIQGDMMKLDFSTSTNTSTSTSNGGKGEEGFDAVLAMYSIIHLPRPEQSEILQRIWTWLKPGGLFLANFSGEGFEGDVDDGWLGGNDGFMYWSGWGKEEIRRILGDVGFEIEIDEVVVDVEMEMDGKEKEVGFHWILARKKVGGEKS